MGLVRTALIFGAGYVLGRPEGRAKVAELAKRPEVAQLREQAANTVYSGLKMGKKQVTEATDKATDKASEKGSAQTNGSGMTTGTGGWRGRRLPSFPRRGARHAASANTATTPFGGHDAHRGRAHEDDADREVADGDRFHGTGGPARAPHPAASPD